MGRLAWGLPWGYLTGFILPAFVLCLWHHAAAQQWIDPVFLPAPAVVVKAFVKMWLDQDLAKDFLASMAIVTQGFLFGAVAALVLGVGAGLSQRFERFLAPTFDTIRHIPGIAWLPLIVLWLGLGAPAKVLVIAKSVFFPVFLNTLQGIRNVDKSYIELAKVMTLSRWQLVRKIILPAALPNVMVSLRYAAGLAWAGACLRGCASAIGGWLASGLSATDNCCAKCCNSTPWAWTWDAVVPACSSCRCTMRLSRTCPRRSIRRHCASRIAGCDLPESSRVMVSNTCTSGVNPEGPGARTTRWLSSWPAT